MRVKEKNGPWLNPKRVPVDKEPARGQPSGVIGPYRLKANTVYTVFMGRGNSKSARSDSCQLYFPSWRGGYAEQADISAITSSASWVQLADERFYISSTDNLNTAFQLDENSFGFHLNDASGNVGPGALLKELKVGDQILINDKGNLHTFIITTTALTEQTSQSYGNNPLHNDVAFSTCDGTWNGSYYTHAYWLGAEEVFENVFSPLGGDQP
jgi:hypothetical protein